MGFPVACTLEPACALCTCARLLAAVPADADCSPACRVYYQAWEAFPILFNFTKEADGTVLLSTLNLSATDKVASFDVNDTGTPPSPAACRA